MTITCYVTNLPPDHSKVLAGNYADKMPTGQAFTLADTLVWGADSLTFQLGSTTLFDYCKATVSGVNYFYFLMPRRVTPAAVEYAAILDYFATYGGGDIVARGYLTQGHELLADTNGTSQITTFGVPMVAGRPKRLITLEDSDHENFFNSVRVVAKYVIKHTTGTPNYDAPLILFSLPIQRSDETLLSSTITLMAQANDVSVSGTWLDVMNVEAMYIIPSRLLSSITTSNASVRRQSSPVDGVLGVCYATGYEKHSYTVGPLPLADSTGPHFYRIGNMGSFVDIPFTGKNTIYMPTFYCELDCDSATVNFAMRYKDLNIDMLPSVTIPFGAFRQSQTQTQRIIGDAVSLVTSGISLAGGIATGNPLAIAGGVVGVGSTASNILQRTAYQITSVAGQGLANTAVVCQSDENVFSWGYLNGVGCIEFHVANLGEVLQNVRENGFIGLRLGNYAVGNIPTGYGKALYRKFNDPLTVYRLVNDTASQITIRLYNEVAQMCRAGFWVFDTVSDLYKGETCDPWAV